MCIDAFLEPSDEEVLGFESVDEDDLDEEDLDDDDDDGEEQEKEDNETRKTRKSGNQDASSPGLDDVDSEDGEDDGAGAWGSTRKDYYNADAIETEADALEEEKEAKKIQQKHLKAMKEADFGFDELDWLESGQKVDGSKQGEDGVVTEVLPQLEITDEMGPEERLKLLKSRYPEFEPLAKDFVDLESTYADLKGKADKAIETMTDRCAPTPIAILKFRAVAAYLGSISMYFAILTSPSQNGETKVAALPPAELREHAVMQSLVNCRKLWETVKDFQIPDVSRSAEVDNPDLDVGSHRQAPNAAAKKKPKKLKAKAPVENHLTKSQRAAELARAQADARRAEKIRKAEADLADLSDLIKKPSKKSTKDQTQPVSIPQEVDVSDFGDEDGLTAREAEEKAKRKRSLRFYTSQIAQKANKRDTAGRDAGGDQDLPYRERLRDRQERLNTEAERRGRKQADETEQLGGDSDDEDYRVAAELRGDGPGTDDDEYYDMVAARNKSKKADKQMRAAALAEAAKEGGRVEIHEEIGPDGKRAISYQIEKNKGLAPKRNKDVRNPRVKKRKKFEQKKKKLGSIRQIYKGGEGRGGYGGELTGIKKNLVKSVKL
jgi:U3 small nucleolar RNA-associated protein 3